MSGLFRYFLNLFPRPWLIRLSYVVRPLIVLWLRGDRYTDPIDGKSYRKFLPYGYDKIRENVLAPGTLSLERHRLCWLFLSRKTDLFYKPQRLLHFAPEQAFLKRFKKMEHLDYVTTDLNSPIADVKADICDLPFEDDSFDFIICNHVLEHIPDDQKAISELFRVLRKGGTAVLQVPYKASMQHSFEDDSIIDPVERQKVFGQYDHVRVYGMDYFDKLEGAGFKVNKVDLCKEINPSEIERFRLPYGELIPVCHK